MKQLLLVRHAQASFESADYDVLSERGHQQSRLLGRALDARGVMPDLVVRGRLRRHEETVAGLLAGQGSSPALLVDPGWDEFDFRHVIEVHEPGYLSRSVVEPGRAAAGPSRQAFQRVFEAATLRWASGRHDADYDETFRAFSARVLQALQRAAAHAPAAGTAVVVSSGGPIAAAVSAVLAGDASLWPALNKVTVNTAVTKLLNGRSGPTLSVFNSHEHLEHDSGLITYR